MNKKITQKVVQAEEVIKNLNAEGKLDTQDIQNMYQFEGENFKKLADRVIAEKRKQWAYRRIAAEESNDEDENQNNDKRDYPRLLKFVRN